MGGGGVTRSIRFALADWHGVGTAGHMGFDTGLGRIKAEAAVGGSDCIVEELEHRGGLHE